MLTQIMNSACSAAEHAQFCKQHQKPILDTLLTQFISLTLSLLVDDAPKQTEPWTVTGTGTVSKVLQHTSDGVKEKKIPVSF